MSGVSITYKVDATEALAGFQKLARVMDDTTPVMVAIGSKLVSNTQERFQRGVDPDGGGWAALNPDYALAKRGPGILRESGMRGGLMGSITFDAGKASVEVGTNKIHARIHQEGGTISAKGGGFLAFRMGGGNSNMVFARSVTIPARPYLGISAEDERDIEDTIADLLEAALPG